MVPFFGSLVFLAFREKPEKSGSSGCLGFLSELPNDAQGFCKESVFRCETPPRLGFSAPRIGFPVFSSVAAVLKLSGLPGDVGRGPDAYIDFAKSRFFGANSKNLFPGFLFRCWGVGIAVGASR